MHSGLLLAIRVSLKFVDPRRKHPETGTNVPNVVRIKFESVTNRPRIRSDFRGYKKRRRTDQVITVPGVLQYTSRRISRTIKNSTMPRKAGASSKGKGRRKGTKRGREEGEDSPRGPTPLPPPPADGADQDLPPTEEERPQEEEDQPPEVVEEADDAADGEATPSPGSQGSKAKKARILSNLNDEAQEKVTVIFICRYSFINNYSDISSFCNYLVWCSRL